MLMSVRAGQENLSWVWAIQECLSRPVLLVCSASHYPAKKNETDAGASGAVDKPTIHFKSLTS